METYADHLVAISNEIIWHPKFVSLTHDEQGKQLLELDRKSINIVADFVQKQLSPEQVKQHREILHNTGPDAAADFLRQTIPNYDARLIELLDAFKTDYLAKLG